MRTIKFFTVGCKVNQYETQSIRESFLNLGFKEIDNGHKADIYCINTCTVTHRADRDSLNFIRKAKKENPKARIVVTGCLAELDEDKIKKIDEMSLIVKNRDKNRIVGLFSGHSAQRTAHSAQLITYFAGHTRAFLKIQDGCNNSCSYCKVPLVRGASRSRDLSEIVQEVRALVKNGFKELVLCGICLGAYGRDLPSRVDLVDVISELERIEGLLRIRLSSIEAGDVTDRLIQKLSGSKKLCRHLHIPIQSGDDDILKRMNRHYTSSDYLDLIHKIKAKVSGIAITTDVLVGFLGETDKAFLNTVELIKEIEPLKVHIFPYSHRQGTSAAKYLNGTLSDKIVKKRQAYLRNIAADCSHTYKKQFLNKKMDLLIEGRHKNELDYWQGYTDNYIKVYLKSGFNLNNQLVNVELKKIVGDAIAAEQIR